MTDEVYSKHVVDQYLAGIFEVLGSVTRTVAEARIADGLATRESAVEMFESLASLTKNAAAKGFYEAMAEQTHTTDHTPDDPKPIFTVISGGRTE